jgi:hypothetical protein
MARGEGRGEGEEGSESMARRLCYELRRRGKEERWMEIAVKEEEGEKGED